MPTVAGIFEDEDRVQEAIRLLLERHIDTSQISVLVSEHGERHEVPIVHRTGIGRGAAIGAVVGTLLGVGLVSTGVLAPLGLVGAGPVLALLQGAAAGAATGSFAGALAGMGFWEDEADLHAEALERGAVWVGVHTEGPADAAEAALREAGARHVARCREP
jgi:hypothetical protein